MTGSDIHRTLHRTAMPSAERERCIRRGGRRIERLLRRFADQSIAIDTAILRKTGGPVVVVDLERGHGWMIPGAGLRVAAGDNIAVHSRRKEFKVFFSGFDRKDRLVCELYVDGARVRSRRLGPGESLECGQDKEAPFRVTRRDTFGMYGCAKICVWADIPKRKTETY